MYYNTRTTSKTRRNFVEKRLYAIIVKYHKKKDGCFIENPKLAIMCNTTVDTIKDTICRLAKDGTIIKLKATHPVKRSKQSRYLIPAVLAKVETVIDVIKEFGSVFASAFAALTPRVRAIAPKYYLAANPAAKGGRLPIDENKKLWYYNSC